jgi:transcriptional regulator GlxA family with amidase domain
LARHAIPAHAGVAAGNDNDTPLSRGHTFVWPENPNVPSTVLVKLLNSAQQALAGDVQEARQFIVKAADLLNAEVERREANERHEASEPANRHLAPWQTRRVIKFVEENLADTIRIEELAEIAHLSARQFSRAFRGDFGEAPYAYVVRQRIERAKEMMLDTEEPLANIAAKIGLSDQPHLTRLFHRMVGESPASWRRHHRSVEL